LIWLKEEAQILVLGASPGYALVSDPTNGLFDFVGGAASRLDRVMTRSTHDPSTSVFAAIRVIGCTSICV